MLPIRLRAFRLHPLALLALLGGACAHPRVETSKAPCPTHATAGARTPTDTPAWPKTPPQLSLTEAEKTELGQMGARAVVEALIDSTGHAVPCTVRVLPGSDLRLGNAGKIAIQSMEFSPAMLNGVPTSVWIQQPFAVGIR